MTTNALPPIVDVDTWQRELDALRVREKAATRELDAIAAQRRRLPMVEMPDYTLEGEDGPVRLADVFDGKPQLIVYHHMWSEGQEWQCSGCTGFTAQFTRLEVLDNFDARFVVVTQGPIDEALAYKRRVGNTMTWYSTANSPFGSDVGFTPRRLRRQRVPPRRRPGLPHLAHERPRHGAARLLLRPHRPAALRAAGGVAGLAGGLAAVPHLQPVGQFPGHRRGVRPAKRRGVNGDSPRTRTHHQRRGPTALDRTPGRSPQPASWSDPSGKLTE